MHIYKKAQCIVSDYLFIRGVTSLTNRGARGVGGAEHGRSHATARAMRQLGGDGGGAGPKWQARLV